MRAAWNSWMANKLEPRLGWSLVNNDSAKVDIEVLIRNNYLINV